MKSRFGLIGLGVMGRNFLLNVADHGFPVSGLDIQADKIASLREEAAGRPVFATSILSEFIDSLEKPRTIMMLVPAGKPVDSVLQELLPHLEKGDLVIDGGNSFFEDTNRRYAEVQAHGIHFLGTGVSGGSEGARFGPSIMPGGDKDAYEVVRPVFEAVAAKVNKDRKSVV